MIYRRRKNAMLNNTLHQIPLFAQLKDDELRCLQQGEELWLPQGEEVYAEGQPAEDFYVLLKGQDRVTKSVSLQRDCYRKFWFWDIYRRSTDIVGCSLRTGHCTDSRAKPFV
jgi:hypothetical protein